AAWRPAAARSMRPRSWSHLLRRIIRRGALVADGCRRRAGPIHGARRATPLTLLTEPELPNRRIFERYRADPAARAGCGAADARVRTAAQRCWNPAPRLWQTWRLFRPEIRRAAGSRMGRDSTSSSPPAGRSRHGAMNSAPATALPRP